MENNKGLWPEYQVIPRIKETEEGSNNAIYRIDLEFITFLRVQDLQGTWYKMRYVENTAEWRNISTIQDKDLAAYKAEIMEVALLSGFKAFIQGVAITQSCTTADPNIELGNGEFMFIKEQDQRGEQARIISTPMAQNKLNYEYKPGQRSDRY